MRAHSSVDGPIAQSVEQLAFNQWVAGSSPARLTTIGNTELTLLSSLGEQRGTNCSKSSGSQLRFILVRYCY